MNRIDYLKKQEDERILNMAESFQRECHALSKLLTNENPKLTVADVTNVWIFKKLAELECSLKELKMHYPIIKEY